LKKAPKILSNQEEPASETRSGLTSVNSSRGANSGNSILEKKKKLRRDLLEKRKSLPSSVCQEKSSLILKVLLSEKAFADASSVALYFPVNGEVDTRGIFKKCIDLEKKVFFPKTRGSDLIFLRTRNIEELTHGAFAIPEPTTDTECARSDELDLVLVPGVAFDLSGNRIGYGKGFYDRFLKDIPRQTRFGLAYRFQVLESVPSHKTDVKTGRIITEDGAIDCLGKEGD
jgi:5-formyltetrahydrofolate cyclo-ligase